MVSGKWAIMKLQYVVYDFFQATFIHWTTSPQMATFQEVGVYCFAHVGSCHFGR